MIYFHSTVVRERISEWSQICLQEKAHAGKWGAMKGWFEEHGHEFKTLAIAKDEDGQIIGAAVQLRYLHYSGFTAHTVYGRDEYNLSVFVKPTHRRQGIGKKLIQKLKSRTKEPILGSPFDDESHKFFKESRA